MTEFVEVKTAELEGAALDWAVDAVESGNPLQILSRKDGSGEWTWFHDGVPFPSGPRKFSTDWSQGGPLIDRHHLSISGPGCMGGPTDSLWSAYIDTGSFAGSRSWSAPTPLIAACRAIVNSVLGDTVQVPKELI